MDYVNEKCQRHHPELNSPLAQCLNQLRHRALLIKTAAAGNGNGEMEEIAKRAAK